MMMLALGANVTSVEPASDFAAAIHESAVLNCWGARHRSLNAFACEKLDHGPRSCMRSRKPWNAYRAGGGGRDDLKERLRETSGRTVAQILAGPESVAAPRARGFLITGSEDTDSPSTRDGTSPSTTGFSPMAYDCLLYTSPSPRDRQKSRMPSSA